jgi:hypothetical protein
MGRSQGVGATYPTINTRSASKFRVTTCDDLVARIFKSAHLPFEQPSAIRLSSI